MRSELHINKKIFIVCILCLSFFSVIGISWAWFSATVTGNDTAKSDVIETANLKLEFSDENIINITNILPGSSTSKTFTVTNTGDVNTTYDINWANVVNTFVDKNDLQYKLESTNNNLNYMNVPSTGNNISILENINISPGTTHTYTLTITFQNKSEDQSDNQGKRMYGKLSIGEVEMNATTMNVKRIPNNYQEVEWIMTNTGNPYINTNVYVTDQSYIYFEGISPNDVNTAGFVFGTRNDANNANDGYWFLTWQGYYKYGWHTVRNGTNSTATANENVIVQFDGKNRTLNVNNTQISLTNITFNSLHPILINAINTEGHYDTQMTKWKIKRIYIKENETYLGDFIPCYRKSDNVVGLFDTVTNSFFVNVGTGSFTKGNNV